MHDTPSLAPDFTLFIQMAIFFASWLVLHALVFKPYLALLKARRDKTVGLSEKAAKAKVRAAQLQAEYDAFMKSERKKVVEWTDEARKKVNEEERAIVSAARDEVGKELQTLRTKVQADAEKARRELLPQIGEYSSHIVSKLVGYAVKVPSTMEGKKPSDSETTVRG